jgi:hypothetical protein
MRSLRFLVLLAPTVLFLAGCSSADTSVENGNVDANGQPVSSVPWNKPENWETQGQLGGLGN